MNLHPYIEALTQMRERGDRWAVYQNVDLSSLSSPRIGHLQFIQYGPTCKLVGFVDLTSGAVVFEECGT